MLLVENVWSLAVVTDQLKEGWLELVIPSLT